MHMSFFMEGGGGFAGRRCNEILGFSDLHVYSGGLEALFVDYGHMECTIPHNRVFALLGSWRHMLADPGESELLRYQLTPRLDPHSSSYVGLARLWARVYIVAF
jgi:hypothetical protein